MDGPTVLVAMRQMSAARNPTRDTRAGRHVVITISGKPRRFEVARRSLTFVPLAIKRRHGSKLIVPPVGANLGKATSSFDLPWIRTLDKALLLAADD